MKKHRLTLKILLIAIITTAISLVGGWVVSTANWFMWEEPRQLAERRNHVLYVADHDLIVNEGRDMLNNPAKYPFGGGDMFPKNMPQYIETLHPSSVNIFPNEGVLLMFQRKFGIFIADEHLAGVPPVIPQPAVEFYPGLWYAEY